MNDSKFTFDEKKMIDDFINDKKFKTFTFKHDIFIAESIYTRPKITLDRGNATSENWSDRMLSDDFVVSDCLVYKVHKKTKHYNSLYFLKYFSKKMLSKDIITICIDWDNNKSHYFHNFEFYPGIGIRPFYINNHITLDSRIEAPPTLKETAQADYKIKNGCGIETVEDYFNFQKDSFLKDMS